MEHSYGWSKWGKVLVLLNAWTIGQHSYKINAYCKLVVKVNREIWHDETATFYRVGCSVGYHT